MGRSPSTPGKAGPRLWEIDALRGMAVVAMVFYHAMWDLSFAGVYPHDVGQGGWRLVARGIAATFLLLVGVSMTLRQARTPRGVPARGWL
ncbi:MAG: DUF1624 domain-containing protein, partial [Limnochordales bacterium]